MLSPSDYIALVGCVAALATAGAAVAAVVYAKGQIGEAQKQLQHSRKIANADFLLRLDEAFQRHNEVHKFLQPAFKWGQNKGGPQSRDDWFLVTSYMGLLERVNYLVENGIEEIEVIDKLYGYRVYNIVSNDVIRRAKLEEKEVARYYEEFIKLWLRLKPLHNQWESFPRVYLAPRSGGAKTSGDSR